MEAVVKQARTSKLVSLKGSRVLSLAVFLSFVDLFLTNFVSHSGYIFSLRLLLLLLTWRARRNSGFEL